MLKPFDWLRLCSNGTELIATLEYQTAEPEIFPDMQDVGPPVSAFIKPCRRCRVYLPLACSGRNYCKACMAITARTLRLGQKSRHSVVIWAYVNILPKGLKTRTGFYQEHKIDYYINDDHHFLLVMDRRRIKPWLQELILYHGSDLKGLIQIFPTCGKGKRDSMGDVLCKAVHLDARFPMDQLRIRFYSNPFQLFMPRARDEKGILTFEITEFMRWLEMTTVLRSLLRPDEQEMLFKVLDIKDNKEIQFYWGRFLGCLNQEAKEMLAAWNIKQWSKNQVILIRELIDYVVYTA